MADRDKALQALNQALRLEQEGREFYFKAAKDTLNEKGRVTFLSLADDEKMHAEMIQRQLDAIEADGAYASMPNLEIEDIDLDAKLFPPDRQQVQERIGPSPNQLEALHVALEIEMRSYDLYRAAARETEDETGRQMYQWLANAEMTHFNLLMTNYESLVSLGGWV